MLSIVTRGSYRVLQGNRALTLLVVGQGFSSLADWLLAVILTAIIYSATGSETAVALISFTRLAPYALVLPWSGIVLDRMDRRHLMAAIGAGRATCVLGLLAVHSQATLPLAFPLVFLSSSLSCVLRPSINSTLPDLVEDSDTVAANSLVSQVDGIAHILGPAVGGALVLLHAPHLALLAACGIFLLSGASLSFAPLGGNGPRQTLDLSPAEVLAGFRYLWRENERVLMALAVAAAGLGLLAGAYYALAVALSNNVFDLGNQGVGWLDAMYGIGGLLASLLMAWLVRGRRVAHLFMAGTALNALGVLLLALSPAGPAPFACIGMVGMADVVIQVTATTILQASAPRDMLARVFTAFEATLVLATLSGALLAGPLLGTLEPRVATLIYALAAGLLLLIALPRLRSLEEVLGLRVFLRGVPLLDSLSRPLLDDLAPRFASVTVPAGAVIVHAGESGDHLFIIRDGEVDVSVDGRPVRRLGPAAYFGEVALLHPVPRTATVRARVQTHLFSLDRAAFQDMLHRADGLGPRLAREASARYQYAASSPLLHR